MSSVLLTQYQSRILGPTEPVDYSSLVMQSYPPQAIQQEPFIGFKVLVTDMMAYSAGNPGDRMRYLEANLGFLRGKGVIIRETSLTKPDGYWILTLPVPRSQLTTALNNLLDVLATIEQYFSIIRDGLFEVNVSGRCHYAETERVLSSLTIPQRYMQLLVSPDNTPYKMGHVQRINDTFMVLRTRWNLRNSITPASIFEDLTVIAQLTASIYH